MKYLLTSLKQKNNTLIMLENVVPAKTAHVRGYGLGVTLSSGDFSWKLSSTFSTVKMTAFSDPTVITQ
jgi:hypothetical protein